MSLTQLQENFVRGVVSGLSQREAYKQAGYSYKNMKDSTIDNTACTLLKNPKVRARHRELLKEQSNLFLWTQEQAFSEYEWLKNQSKNQMLQEGVRHATATAYVSALEGMNEMAFEKLDLVERKLLADVKRAEAEAEKARQQADPDVTQEDQASGLVKKLFEVLDE